MRRKCHKNGSTPGRFGFEGNIEPKRSICTERRRDITDLDKLDTVYVENDENHGIRPKSSEWNGRKMDVKWTEMDVRWTEMDAKWTVMYVGRD